MKQVVKQVVKRAEQGPRSLARVHSLGELCADVGAGQSGKEGADDGADQAKEGKANLGGVIVDDFAPVVGRVFVLEILEVLTSFEGEAPIVANFTPDHFLFFVTKFVRFEGWAFRVEFDVAATMEVGPIGAVLFFIGEPGHVFFGKFVEVAQEEEPSFFVRAEAEEVVNPGCGDQAPKVDKWGIVFGHGWLMGLGIGAVLRKDRWWSGQGGLRGMRLDEFNLDSFQLNRLAGLLEERGGDTGTDDAAEDAEASGENGAGQVGAKAREKPISEVLGFKFLEEMIAGWSGGKEAYIFVDGAIIVRVAKLFFELFAGIDECPICYLIFVAIEVGDNDSIIVHRYGRLCPEAEVVFVDKSVQGLVFPARKTGDNKARDTADTRNLNGFAVFGFKGDGGKAETLETSVQDQFRLRDAEKDLDAGELWLLTFFLSVWHGTIEAWNPRGGKL